MKTHDNQRQTRRGDHRESRLRGPMLVSILGLPAALAMAPLALDWRSPLLAGVRPWALAGLLVAPGILILAEAWVLWTTRRCNLTLTVLAALGLLLAGLVLTSTLALELRFHWVRHQVLHADPDRLARLGRHLVVGYRDLDEVQELVRLRAVTGVYLSSRNVRGKSIAEIRGETELLQGIRRQQGLPPLWITTDQEGGVVSRLSPPLPHPESLSEIVQRHPDPDALRRAVLQLAGEQARGLREVGVNLNLAPVVDVSFELINPADRYTRISERAIATDPQVVTRVAGWYCAALAENGVHCTLKHFPGLGRVYADTHTGQAELTAPVAELTATDWIPFRTLMPATGAFTMLSHVKLRAVDGAHPASVSSAVITGILRGEWQHDGVLISDDMTMGAIYRSNAGIGSSCVQALNAGLDLILISYDGSQYYQVMHALLQAEARGELDAGCLERSEQRLARISHRPGEGY